MLNRHSNPTAHLRCGLQAPIDYFQASLDEPDLALMNVECVHTATMALGTSFGSPQCQATHRARSTTYQHKQTRRRHAYQIQCQRDQPRVENQRKALIVNADVKATKRSRR